MKVGHPRTWLLPVAITALTVGSLSLLITWGSGSERHNEAGQTYTVTEEATVTETTTIAAEPTAKLQPMRTEDNTWEGHSGDYGYETDATTRCNGRSQAQAVFTTEDSSATCDFAIKVGDSLGGHKVTSDDVELSAFSDASEEFIDVTCHASTDGDDFPYWDCNTEYGSGIIIYP